jgi:hypothetical protein
MDDEPRLYIRPYSEYGARYSNEIFLEYVAKDKTIRLVQNQPFTGQIWIGEVSLYQLEFLLAKIAVYRKERGECQDKK